MMVYCLKMNYSSIHHSMLSVLVKSDTHHQDTSFPTCSKLHLFMYKHTFMHTVLTVMIQS